MSRSDLDIQNSKKIASKNPREVARLREERRIKSIKNEQDYVRRLEEVTSSLSYPYCMASPDNKKMRIGKSDQRNGGRLSDHKHYDYRLVACMLGSEIEKKIFKAFKGHEDYNPGGDTSHYKFEPVNTWCQQLLERGFAVSRREDLWQCPDYPWENWSPGGLALRPLSGRLFYPGGAELSDANQAWRTPVNVWKAIRGTFGERPDLDVASDMGAQMSVPEEFRPRYFISPAVDALSQNVHWWGTCYCNPPYASQTTKKGYSTKHFVAKAMKEWMSNNLLGFILTVNLDSLTTEYMIKLCDETNPAIAISKRRISFVNSSDPEKSNHPSNGTAFLYLGTNRDVFFSSFEKYVGVIVPNVGRDG